MRFKSRLKLMTILPFFLFLVVSLIYVITAHQANKKQELVYVADQVIINTSDLNVLTYEYASYRADRTLAQWQIKLDTIKRLLEDSSQNQQGERTATKKILKNIENIESNFNFLIQTREQQAGDRNIQTLQARLHIPKQSRH